MAIGSAPEIGLKFSTGKKTPQEVRDGIDVLTSYYAKASDGDINHYPPRFDIRECKCKTVEEHDEVCLPRLAFLTQ